MRILFATAELSPLVKVGGLGDFSSGFVRAIRSAGADIEIALPDYGTFDFDSHATHDLDVPAWCSPAKVRRGFFEDAPLTVFSVPEIDKPNPYVDSDGKPWPDNDRRFFGFSAAVADWARRSDVDVLHLNDWHVAAVLSFLNDPPPAILTVHNLAYQGTTGKTWLERFPNRRESFLVSGETNPLAGGIAVADRVVAVSPNFVRETLPPNEGFGLAHLLASRGHAYTGILNGIDTDTWDPKTDPHIGYNYDLSTIELKEKVKGKLAGELGLDVTRGPLVGMVTRLTDQKGIDIALGTIDGLIARGGAMILLGSGERELADAARAVAARHPRRFMFRDGYDEALSHRIFAASDLFLMPSRFEPAGLAHMQAMRYGSIPVVTDVGGLHDSVVDADSDPGSGTGFVAGEVSASSVAEALSRAIDAWGSPDLRRQIAARGMEADWSWHQPAREYLDLYTAITSAR